MKKLYFSLMLLFIVSSVLAQTTEIPDANFEQALIDLGYDDVIDGYVLTSNISNLETLDVSNKYIWDLKGIEDFTNLTELFCQNNTLGYLDLMENIKLKVLNFSNSNGYDYERLPINLSKNVNLEYLNCSGNRFYDLNVGHMSNLNYLNCSYNKIEGINVSQNLKLKEFNCSYNYISNLNIITHSALTDLDCSGNMIKNIDITNNTELTSLRLGGNQISNLDLSKNINLEYFYFGSNPIAEINLTELSSLKVVYSVYNHNLSSLDLSQNTNIEEVSCFQNYNLLNINILGCIDLKYLNCRTNQLENLDLSTNINLEVLWCQNNQLKSLDLNENKNLEFLDCQNNQLENLSVRNGNNSLMKGGEIVYDTILTYKDGMNATDNPLLKCIEVDNEIDATNGIEPYNAWIIDSPATYSEDCQNYLGVDVEGLNQSIKFYPNPVTNVLSIKSETTPINKVEIYNILGQKEIEINSDFNSISTTNLSKGIYLIKIHSEKITTVRKLIKQY